MWWVVIGGVTSWVWLVCRILHHIHWAQELDRIRESELYQRALGDRFDTYLGR